VRSSCNAGGYESQPTTFEMAKVEEKAVKQTGLF